MVAERAQEASRCLKNVEENFRDSTCNLVVGRGFFPPEAVECKFDSV